MSFGLLACLIDLGLCPGMIFRGRLFDRPLGLLDLPLQLRELFSYLHDLPPLVVL
jgi:hypothetical protein